MTREVVLDTETTGRSHQQDHRIISLGVVEMVHGRITGREREWFFNPGRPCDPGAYEVHRIADWWLAKQPDFRSAHRDIADFIGEDRIVAHSAPFDRGFLNMEFGRLLGMSTLTQTEANRFPAEQWTDTLRVARKRFPKQSNSLDALADRFGVYRGHRVKHGALKDARILANVWIELRRGDQAGLFDDFTEEELRPMPPPPVIDYANRKPAPSRLTQAELDRWQEVWGDTLGEGAVWNDYIEKP